MQASPDSGQSTVDQTDADLHENGQETVQCVCLCRLKSLKPVNYLFCKNFFSITPSLHKHTHSEIWQVHTLKLTLNLGTAKSFVSVLCTLRSIMDWLISDTAPFDPLLSSPEVLACGWILLMMSLRELKLSDCGTIRIKGFCEGEKNILLLFPGEVKLLTAAAYSRRWRVLHIGATFIGAVLLLQYGLCPWTLSSRCRGKNDHIVFGFRGLIVKSYCSVI